MRILIAEDDSFLQTVYKTELEKAGYEVSCVEDGAAAMDSLHVSKPDLLLLDVLMPKKDGFQVLKEKQADPLLKGIPVVMLTSLGQESDVKSAMELGASDYFLKTNMDLDELVNLVKQILPNAA